MTGAPPEDHIPIQVVTWKELRKGGGEVERSDTCGAVFHAVKDQQNRPAWSFPGSRKDEQVPMLTCPRSAIPAVCYDMLNLWFECRTLGIPPRAGGLLDQPQIVRYTFPIFAREMKRVDGNRSAAVSAELAASAAASMLTLLVKAKR